MIIFFCLKFIQIGFCINDYNMQIHGIGTILYTLIISLGSILFRHKSHPEIFTCVTIRGP